MRANTRGSIPIASPCAASRGSISASIARTSGVDSVPTAFDSSRRARCSRCPAHSSATIVSSKDGGHGPAAIASTSARCSAIPASSSGRNGTSKLEAIGRSYHQRRRPQRRRRRRHPHLAGHAHPRRRRPAPRTASWSSSAAPTDPSSGRSPLPIPRPPAARASPRTAPPASASTSRSVRRNATGVVAAVTISPSCPGGNTDADPFCDAATSVRRTASRTSSRARCSSTARARRPPTASRSTSAASTSSTARRSRSSSASTCRRPTSTTSPTRRRRCPAASALVARGRGSAARCSWRRRSRRAPATCASERATT